MGRTSYSNIHKLINSIWKKEELYPFMRQVMKDIVVIRGIPILSTAYKILSNILTPYAKEIIGDHQCGFQCKRSTTDHIFCICQILGTK